MKLRIFFIFIVIYCFNIDLKWLILLSFKVITNLGYNMIEPDLNLQKPLEDYIEFIEKLNSRSIPLLGEMVDPILSFQDPYHNIKGFSEVQLLLERRLNICADVRYKVSDFMWGRREATAYIYWNFSYKQKKKSFRKSLADSFLIEGMSELKFYPDGKIFSISEFWGAHDGFDVKSYEPSITE